MTGRKKRWRKPKSPKEATNEGAKDNITDLESRIMKSRWGWVQGYNGQTMADCDSQVIIAHTLTQAENDSNQLAPMQEACGEQAGRCPKKVLGDAYWSEKNANLQNDETELFIATKKDWKQRMERKLLTKRGKAAYRQRGATIEAVFGQMAMRGLNGFLLRGVEKTKGEWLLWCTTHNLLKLWRSGYGPTTVSA